MNEVTLTLHTDQLLEALTLLQPIIENRSQELLKNVCIRKGIGGEIEVIATDGEIWGLVPIKHLPHSDLKHFNATGVVVNFKSLQDRVKLLKGKETTLTYSNELKAPDDKHKLPYYEWSKLEVTSATTNAKFIVGAAEDYPSNPTIETGSVSKLRLSIVDINHIITRAKDSVSTDAHRQVLTGYHFTQVDSKLNVVSTDTHRLSVVPMGIAFDSDIAFTMPGKVVDLARKAYDSQYGKKETASFIFMNAYADHTDIQVGKLQLVSKNLIGMYPNWQRVVPEKTTNVWTMETRDLKDALKSVMPVAKNAANRVRFSYTEGSDTVILSAAITGGESVSETFRINVERGPDADNTYEYDGKTKLKYRESLDIAVNGNYMLEALETLGKEALIQFDMTASSRPMVVHGVHDTSFVVIMPMSLE
jgi:DNA polymerase-3 subunit beta